jgi:cyanophycinase
MKGIKPVYLLAGGNWRKPGALLPVLKEVIKATGKGTPIVAYIGAANGDDRWFFKFANNFLIKAGAAKVTQVFLASREVDLKSAKSTLSSADAIFVSGGDVEEGMRWLSMHKLLPFLKDLYTKGVLFFGLSAGSIMLGTQWVRWSNPKDDGTAELFKCMGIAPVLCDTHAEKDKWEELIMAVKLLGKNGKGYGIPTGGLLLVNADGTVTALEKPASYYINEAGHVVKADNIPMVKK